MPPKHDFAVERHNGPLNPQREMNVILTHLTFLDEGELLIDYSISMD